MTSIPDKMPMCLSPQEKLRYTSTPAGMALRKSAAVRVDDLKIADDEVLPDDEVELDMDASGWISDENLRGMELDERVSQDLDWNVPDEVLDMSLSLEFASTSETESNTDFVEFGAGSFLSPMRGGLFEDGDDVASSFVAEALSEPPTEVKDAEMLLMSFDTMHFTIPSPTSASSRKRRASFSKFSELSAPERKIAKDSSKTAVKKESSPVMIKTESGLPQASNQEPTVKLESLQETTSLSITAPEKLSASAPVASTSVECARKIGSYSPRARKLRIQKFHEKRKNRTWKKSIKYDCRKKLADDRPRVKGRFVRVMENKDDGCSSQASTASSSSANSSPVPEVNQSLTGPSTPAPASAPSASTLAVQAAMATPQSRLPLVKTMSSTPSS